MARRTQGMTFRQERNDDFAAKKVLKWQIGFFVDHPPHSPLPSRGGKVSAATLRVVRQADSKLRHSRSAVPTDNYGIADNSKL